MKTYRIKQSEVRAIQFSSCTTLDGVIFTSEGWRQSGHWSDRFREEPEKPSPYILEDNKKVFIKISDWIVNKDGNWIKMVDSEFKRKYEEI